MFTFLTPAMTAAVRQVLFKTGEIALETVGLVGLSATMYFVGRKANHMIADGYAEVADAVDYQMERRLARRHAEKQARRVAFNEQVDCEIKRRISAGELIRATIIPPTSKAAPAEAPA
jgi:hypothetical protein